MNSIHTRTILLTGSNSLLGKALYDELASKHHLTLTYHKTKPNFSRTDNTTIQPYSHTFLPLDITSAIAMQEMIAQNSPDIIIHLASMSDIDYCQTHQEKAKEVNVDGTRNIVKAIENFPKTKLVFLSSSMVFDGQTANPTESHAPKPINYYGETKLAAEQLVQQSPNPWLIIRPTTLYGWQPTGTRENPVTFIVKSLRSGWQAEEVLRRVPTVNEDIGRGKSTPGPASNALQNKYISMVSDYFTNPLYAPDAAAIIAQLIARGSTGIYHIAGATRVSRFAWAKQTARVFDLDSKLIKPQKMDTFDGFASRPSEATLSTKKVEKELNITTKTLKKGLRKMKAATVR